MIAIIPFIILWVRMAKFGSLTTANLPGATQENIEQMRKASKTAFIIMLVGTILSFLPYAFVPNKPVYGSSDEVNTYNSAAFTANAFMIAFGVGGLLVAACFDYKAERIKKRCRTKAIADGTISAETVSAENSAIRWYHFVFAILMPYVGLPWGIVNLVRKRYRSGLMLIFVSIVMFFLFGVVLPYLITGHSK